MLLAAAVGALLVLSTASAQGACAGEPAPPHCVEPDVEVELPDAVRASYETLEGGEPATLTVEVNVTYDSPAEDESEVTVEPAGSPFQAEGGAETVSTGETVTVPVGVVVAADARAGAHEFPLVVNTSATDVHEPTSQRVGTEVRVPWIVSGHTTTVPSFETSGDEIRAGFRTEVLVNGPVDVLATSELNTVEPRVHEPGDAFSQGALETSWEVRVTDLDDGAYELSLWPVVSAGDGLACIGDEGRPVGLEGGAPPEECRRIGGISGQVSTPSGASRALHLAAVTSIALGMVGALGLGVYVLRQAWREVPGLSLGGYLVLAGIGFGTLAATELGGLLLDTSVSDLVGFDENFLIFPTMALLPGALLTFAVSYPTLHPALRGRRAWPLVTMGPSLLLAVYLVVSFALDGGPNDMPLSRGVPLIGGFVLGALLAAWIFRRRSHRASTDLEHRRLRYMERAVALPFGGGAALLLALYVPDVLGLLDSFPRSLQGPVLAVMALGPAAGMAWGLLKYKVVDLETKLRFTVSRGFVVSVFVAIFFVASEAAETFFTDAIGPYAGLVAAGLLVLAIAPLERMGSRLASGVVDEPVDEDEYEKFRRLEVYRATYEEATADEALTDRERGTLDSMAENLGLSEEERRFVEEQVAEERAERNGAAPATAAG